MSVAIALCSSSFEVLINAYYLFSLLHRRYSKSVSAVIYALLCFLSIGKHILLFEQMLPRTLMQFGLYALMLLVLFTDPFWKRFGLLIVYVVGVAFVDSLTAYFSTTFFHRDLSCLDASCIPFICIEFSVCTVYTFALVHFFRRRKDTFESRAVRFVLIYCAIQIALCLCQFLLMYDYGMNALPLFFLFLLTVAVSVVFGIALFRTMKRSFAQKVKAEAAEMRMSLYEEELSHLKIQHEEYKKLRSNYYHHIRTLQALKDPDKRSAYIDELTKEVLPDRELAVSGDEALDALLFYEKLRAERLGIHTEFKANGVETLSVAEADVCAVVSALLKDAVRRALAVDPAADRFISAAILAKDGHLVINVRGSCAGELEEHLCATAEEIAQKYDGSVVDTCDKGVYSCTFNAKL